MTRGRARRYLLTKQGYYPGVVASMGYDVWDWSTLNAGTLFQDSAKTTPASANGDVIGCWTDGVGGVDATQVTTVNKPGLATASLGTLPTLSFDGGDLLATGNISISTFAVWCVFRSSTASRMVYELGTDATTQGLFLFTSAAGQIIVTNSVQSRKTITDSTLLTDNTFRVSRLEYNDSHASHKIAFNNTIVATSTVAGNNPTSSFTLPFNIGARSGVSFPMIGNIAHLCIVSPYPTDASIIANMESYINSKWSVY